MIFLLEELLLLILKKSGFMKLILFFICYAVLIFPSFKSKATTEVFIEPIAPYVEFKASNLILTYSIIIPMLENRDPTPLLRLYEDGKVHVHYPNYMKKAGDYISFINEEQVKTLFKPLENNTLSRINKNNKQFVNVNRKSMEVSTISDSSIFFLEYKNKSGVIEQFKIRNLEDNRTKYSDFEAFQLLYLQEKELNRLIEQVYSESK